MWNFFTKERIFVKGKNVDIRSANIFDYKHFAKWFRNTDIMGYAFGLIAEDDYIMRVSNDYYREVTETPQNILTIMSKTGKHLGLIRFSLRDYEKKYAIIGILLGEQRFIGKGFGTEAMMLTLEYFFTEKHLSYVELDTAVFNERAQRSFKKCGFVPVGEFQEVDYNTGNVFYKILMRLHRNQFFEQLENSREKNADEQET